MNGRYGEWPFRTDITRAPSEQFPAVSRTGARNEMESGQLCALQRVVGGPQSKKMTNTSRRFTKWDNCVWNQHC